MNKNSYRIIFNKKRGTLMAVAETVKSRGKESYSSRAPTGQQHPPLMRLIGLAVAVAAAFGNVTVVNAQIVSDPNAAGNKRPVIDTTANGRPLVQIATPSAAGVSHNQYNQFNVGANGVILNNTQGAVQTQLGGYVGANPNLANGAARVILNEVTGTSGSLLRGYTEVAGQRAEVIIANPNGISCDGCGFINTSRGILTTGTPVFGGGGSLEAFRVTSGRIQIGAGGLNGANMDQLDLIARSVEVNGELWSNQLNVIAGANQVNYADMGVQVIQGEGNKPTVGIDVAQLGGMYANKIRLVGTEAGVGVNSLGNIAAQAGELNIDNAGKITLAGKTSATEKLTLSSGDDIANSGTLYGQQAVNISSQGQIVNRGATVAQGDLSLKAAAIDSTGTVGAGVDANGNVTQSGNLQMASSGAVSATGANVAGGNIAIAGTGVNLAGAQTAAGGNITVATTVGDIDHTNANLSAGGPTTLTAGGSVRNDGGTINSVALTVDAASLSNKAGQLLQSGVEDSRITVAGAIDNSGGKIIANGEHLQLRATDLINSQGRIEHAGHGGLTLELDDLRNDAGVVATNGQLDLTADNVGNEGGKLSAAGKANVFATGDIANRLGQIQSGAELRIAARSLDNTAGRVVALGSDGLTLSVTGQIVNRSGLTAGGMEGGVVGGNGDVTITAAEAINSGRISAAGNLSVVTGGALANDGGQLTAGNALTLDATRLTNSAGSIDAANLDAKVEELNNNAGKITADQLQLNAAYLANRQGQIAQYGDGVTTVAVSGAIDNSNGGVIHSNGADLGVTAASLDNRDGTIAHAGTGNLTIGLAGELAGQRGTISGNGQVDVSAVSVANQGGALFGQRATTVTASNGDIDNSANGYIGGQHVTVTASEGQVNNTGGTVEASADGIAIRAQSLANAGGTVQNLGAAAVDIATVNEVLNTVADGKGGVIGSEGVVAVTAAAIDNAGGTVFGKDGLLLRTDGDVTNTGGNLRTMGDGDIGAGGVLHNESGRIESNGTVSTLTVSGSKINNAGGKITNAGTGATRIASGSELTNSNAAAAADMGIIGGNGDVVVSATSIANAQGSKIIAGNNLALDASGTVNNNSGASVTASGDITLNAATFDNSGGKIGTTAHGGGSISIGTAGNIVNTAGLIGSSRDLQLNAQTIDGAAGQIMAGGDATVALRGDFHNAAGSMLQADGNLSLSTSGTLTNDGTIRAVNTLTVDAAHISNRAGGDLNASTTTVSANGGSGNLVNAGSIGGDAVSTRSNRLDNTGSVIGGDVTVNANVVTNSGNAAVIAAADRADLFVKDTLVNADGALIYSLGGMTIAADGARDASGNLLYKTRQLTNSSATIETDGDLSISAESILNKRTTLQIRRDIYDGTTSWSKYNYYWRNFGTGMSGPDSAGLMAPVTRTLPFNDPAAFGSRYGSILQVDPSTKRALIQFGGSNQLWVYYKDIKKNANNTYDMTFYEGRFCPGWGEQCPYQNIVYREYAHRPVVEQFDPNRHISPAELQYVGINGQSAYDLRERTFNGSVYHDELVAASAAGKIAASGKIAINTGGLTNDASDIIAGGALTISGGAVVNRGYSINRTEVGTTVDHYDRHVGQHSYTTINQTMVTSLATIDASIQSNQGVAVSARNIDNTTVNAAAPAVGTASLGANQGGGLTGSGNNNTTAAASGTPGAGAGVTGTSQTVGSATKPLPNLILPQNGLFSLHPEPGHRYLVETNPHFTNYREFLSSDYMLSRMAVDPEKIQKRLGDGFYEQKLINDQITQLSGKRFLDGYASAEEQFKALMESGVAVAEQFNLTPGIGLTAEQMAQLTRDIVWMVSQEVTLPDGSRQQALVPVVYLTQAHQAEIKPSGALIGGQQVVLEATDSISNGGSIKARETLRAQANVIENTGGELQADQLTVKGTQQLTIATDFQSAGRQGSVRGRDVWLEGGDVNISGAKVAATESLVIKADNNLTVGTATAQRSASLEWGKAGNSTADHGLMRDGGVSASWTQVLGSSIESGGDLAMQANKDITIKGSSVAAADQAGIVAGGQVNIEADKNITNSHVTGLSDRNQLDTKGYNESVVGSSVEGGKGLTIFAQGKDGSTGDVNIVAGSLSSSSGETTIGAAGSIRIGATTARNSNDLLETGRDTHVKTDESTTLAIGSHVGGEKGVTLLAQGSNAGGRIDIVGSDVTSNGQINIVAEDTVNIAESHSQSEYERTGHYTNKKPLSKKSTETNDYVAQDMANGSMISGDQVNIQSGRDINVVGSQVAATGDLTLSAKDNVKIAAAQNTVDEIHTKQVKESGLMSSGGIGITIGSRQQDGNGKSGSTTHTASTVGSTDGNVSILAGNQYEQTGSNVIALQGDIDVLAKKVEIVEAQDTYRNAQETRYKQSGLTVALTNPVISATQTGLQMQEAASQTSDPRMKALAAATTALAAKNAYDAVQQKPAQAGGVNLSFSVGASKSQSNSTQSGSTAVGSGVVAGGDVHIRATGADGDSDITARGANIKAGNDVVLQADDQINLLAAHNTAEQHSTNNSSSASIGFSIGTDNSFQVSASKGRGNADGSDVTWTNTNVEAGSKLTLEAGGDATLKGAAASGKQVVAEVGGNLTIESLQDTSKYDSKQKSAGGSISVGTGGVGVSVNYSKSNIESDYASVTEQSGIKAGDGGFQVQVSGNTDLKGAVIASTDKAVQDGKNQLDTATFTQSDIHNHADYKGQSVGLGLGYSTNDQGVGKDQQGRAQTGGSQTPGTTLPSHNGFSATPPVAMSASDDASSTTHSGISGASISITDEAKQKELTGKDAATTVASINRDVSTDRDTSNALKPIFNEQEIKAGFEIVGALVRETGTFLVNRAKEVDQARQAAKEKDAKADAKEQEIQQLPDGDEKTRLQQEAQIARAEAIAARLEAQEIEQKWSPGGTYRQVMTAVTAAAGGNVAANGSQFVQSTIVNLVQSKAAEGIKQLADDFGIPEGSPAHAALHAINACIGAATQAGNCGAAALGAASASVVGALLAETQGDAEKLTNEQKEARQALVNTLVTGVAAATGNAAAANTAALIEMENNSNVKNLVKAAINEAKDYLGAKAKQGGEKIGNLLEKLESKTLVEKRDAIARYLDEAAAKGGLSESEIAALGLIYAANATLFPTSVLDVTLGAGKAVGKAGDLIKAGVRAEDAAKVASAEMKATGITKYVPNAGAVGNMQEFLKMPGFGKDFKDASRKTNYQFQGQSIYETTTKIGENIKKGDLVYLDAAHMNHLEVFKGNGEVRAVLNLDGTINRAKTDAAIAEGRRLKLK